MSANRRIAVAMSGGVDSSVSAALLSQQGDEIFGIMLRLWSDGKEQNRCCSPADMSRARQVAATLGIPFYVLDAKESFKREVVDFFISGYSLGLTPNPCIECNRSIRWDFLLQRAMAMGATHFATGHYARILHDETGFRIARAVDRMKDQSYVLSILTQDLLAHTLLPLGEIEKAEVRDIARSLSLPVADRPDSQDLCFIGAEDYRDFLSRHSPAINQKGYIRDIDGQILGEHHGLYRYTIGQRKGLGLSLKEPHYVIEKEQSSNSLVVGSREELGRSSFQVGNVNWIEGRIPSGPLNVGVQVRYKAREVPAILESAGVDTAKVNLSQALPDVTPGQLAVFYDEDICLGGGVIER